MANWMASAVKRPGQLHRDLGVPVGQKIPRAKIDAAAARGGAVGRRAKLAETFAKFRPKKKASGLKGRISQLRAGGAFQGKRG